MTKYFSIGEVSKLFDIPSSTLRYYDNIGLFQPSITDTDSGYRYYTVEQFVLIDTIKFLRQLDIPITVIEEHMKNRTIDNTANLFQKQLQQVKQEIISLEKASGKLQQMINTMNEGKNYYNHLADIEFKWYPKRPISLIYVDPSLDIESSIDIYIRQLDKTLPPTNKGIFSGDIGLLLDLNRVKDRILSKDSYLGIFYLYDIHDPYPDTAAFLQEGTYACLPHIGPYHTLQISYQRLFDELNEQGYQAVGDIIEISLIDEMAVESEENFVTIIQIAVKEVVQKVTK